MSEPRFKSGDRIRVVGGDRDVGFIVGTVIRTAVHTVIGVREEIVYLVRFGEGLCRFFGEENLAFADSKPMTAEEREVPVEEILVEIAEWRQNPIADEMKVRTVEVVCLRLWRLEEENDRLSKVVAEAYGEVSRLRQELSSLKSETQNLGGETATLAVPNESYPTVRVESVEVANLQERIRLLEELVTAERRRAWLAEDMLDTESSMSEAREQALALERENEDLRRQLEGKTA